MFPCLLFIFKKYLWNFLCSNKNSIKFNKFYHPSSSVHTLCLPHNLISVWLWTCPPYANFLNQSSSMTCYCIVPGRWDTGTEVCCNFSIWKLTPKGPRHPKWAFCALGRVLWIQYVCGFFEIFECCRYVW
jgi:hypothetical protein